MSAVYTIGSTDDDHSLVVPRFGIYAPLQSEQDARDWASHEYGPDKNLVPWSVAGGHAECASWDRRGGDTLSRRITAERETPPMGRLMKKHQR